MKKLLLRRISNRILHALARSLPGATTLRPFLHRLRGVKTYGRVFIGDDVYIENEYPECVEIHDQAAISLRTLIVAHTKGPGKILIKEKAHVGANCVIMGRSGLSLTIGEGSVIAAGSVVLGSIPPHTFFGREPDKALAKVTVPFTGGVSYEAFVAGLKPIESHKDT